jgi:hypothetical protein
MVKHQQEIWKASIHTACRLLAVHLLKRRLFSIGEFEHG